MIRSTKSNFKRASLVVITLAALGGPFAARGVARADGTGTGSTGGDPQVEASGGGIFSGCGSSPQVGANTTSGTSNSSGNTGGSTGGVAGSGGSGGSGGTGGSTGGVAGSGGNSTGGGGTGGMTTTSSTTTTTTMAGPYDKGLDLAPVGNPSVMHSSDVKGGVAGPIVNGSTCWNPAPGDTAVFSVAPGASPCSGETVSATATKGPSFDASVCPGGLVRYAGCAVGCIALNTQAAMESQAMNPTVPQSGNYDDPIANCNGQKLTIVYKCVAN